MKMTGSVETRTSLRGRKPVLSNDKKKSLHASEQERPRHSIEAKKLGATYSGERRKVPCVSR